MQEWICGTSAFHLYRTPPQVRCLLPSFPDISTSEGKRVLRSHYLEGFGWGDALGTLPISTLVFDKKDRRTGSTVKTHLWSGALPPGAFWDDDELGITLSSPAFTLLSMAPQLSVVNLAMAMYELCGAFSIFHPSNTLQKRLDDIENQRIAWPGSWRQVRDASGKPTSLWMRDPLIERHELNVFGHHFSGMRGSAAYFKALDLVTGITASPLEVQVSILLRAPRCMGGEGFPDFFNNLRIALSQQARRLAEQDVCYADIFFYGSGRSAGVDLECHGHMVHDGGARSRMDVNRALALQSMGIEVMHVSSEQISNAARFDALCQHLAEEIGFERKPKTARMLASQSRLRSELFIDWRRLAG